jgi:hypothetical protein
VQVGGVVALLAVVVAILFMLLNWYVAPTKPSEKKDLVLALAQILGGAALLSGLYFTWRTLQINREGQITERFTRAIDQLGATDDAGNRLFEIRLGGIYALERIARESEEDYWPIMEVLTAYVRQNAPRRQLEEGQDGTEDAAVERTSIMEVLTAYVRQHAPWRPEEAQQGEEGEGVEKSEEDSGGLRQESEPTEVPAPDPDIQAILTVLRRRTRYYGHGETESLDLHETTLTGAALWRADLRGAHLQGADLRGAANLTRAQLEGTRRDENTRLPSDPEPPEHWGVKTDEQTEGG